MPKMRTLDEISQRHKNLKQVRRKLARETQDTLIREETLNWVMGGGGEGAETEETSEETPTEEVEATE